MENVIKIKSEKAAQKIHEIQLLQEDINSIKKSK